MLATLGFLVPEVIGTWPSSSGLFVMTEPLTALGTVPLLGIIQILGVITLIESRTGDGTSGGRTPGDIGFDPLNFSTDGIDERLALAELKNGRLAMVASIAFVAQSAIAHKGIVASTFETIVSVTL